MCVTAGREECRQCSREKGCKSVVLFICTVKGEGLAETQGEGLAETQGEGLPEKIKGAALAATDKILCLAIVNK